MMKILIKNIWNMKKYLIISHWICPLLFFSKIHVTKFYIQNCIYLLSAWIQYIISKLIICMIDYMLNINNYLFTSSPRLKRIIMSHPGKLGPAMSKRMWLAVVSTLSKYGSNYVPVLCWSSINQIKKTIGKKDWWSL